MRPPRTPTDPAAHDALTALTALLRSAPGCAGDGEDPIAAGITALVGGPPTTVRFLVAGVGRALSVVHPDEVSAALAGARGTTPGARVLADALTGTAPPPGWPGPATALACATGALDRLATSAVGDRVRVRIDVGSARCDLPVTVVAAHLRSVEPGPVHGPATSWDADLGDGVGCRVPLGVTPEGTVLWARPYEPVLCACGQPRSGKTSGVVVPSVLAWHGSALVVSARFDVADVTGPARRARGPVFVWDPSGLRPDGTTARYDLLRAGASTWADALRTAGVLAAAAPTGQLSDGSFWTTLTVPLLAGVLFAASSPGHGLADVVRWLHTCEEYEVRALIAGKPDAESFVAMAALEGIWQLDDRVRSSVYATSYVLAEVFQHASVQASLGEGFTADDLLGDTPATVFLVAPPADQKAYASLMTLVVGQVLQAAVAHHVRTGGPAGLLVAIDEAGNTVAVPDLPEHTTTAAGCGIQLVTAFHDPDQIVAAHGTLGAATVIDNSPAVLFLHGRSRSAGALLDDLVGPGDGPHGAARLRAVPRGHALVVTDECDPQLLRLLAHWRDPDLGAALG